jgi:hypothetical protein
MAVVRGASWRFAWIQNPAQKWESQLSLKNNRAERIPKRT